MLPLTNCAFDKSGKKFITGSYDRTCKVWDTNTGEELLSLDEHNNVVYTMAFNNPYGDKIVTGSFDRKAKIWDANTGQMYHTLKGHKMEIVCLSFDPHGMLVATGSGVRVAQRATAKEDGLVGDWIRVQPGAGGRVLRAEVISANEARITIGGTSR